MANEALEEDDKELEDVRDKYGAKRALRKEI